MEKQINPKLKNALIGIGVIFLYLGLYSMPANLLTMFGINYNNLNSWIKTIYLIIYEISLTLLIIYIYRKDIIPNFKDFVKNNISYFKKYIKYWFIMLGLMILSNALIIFLTPSNMAGNQEAIMENLKVAPVYTFFMTVFIAPVLEELIFRLSIRKIFTSNILFIITSGIVFGGMHIVGSYKSLIDLLYLIPYSIPGFIFAYIYTKTKNVFVPISIHFIHNGVMMLLQILLLILN